MNNQEFNLADAIDVIEEVLESGGEFCISPKGISMLPLIVEGRDSVVLKRDFENVAKKHDIAFYRRANGQFVLHRVMRIDEDGTYVMCGDNQTVLERGVPASAIIAVISSITRKGKRLDMSGAAYSIYVALWTKMLIRRPALFCRRAVRKIFRILGGVFKKRS